MNDALTAALTELEHRVQEALRTANAGAIESLGYGDSSVVLACDTPAGRFACKRLPPFASLAELRNYAELIRRYAAELEARGVRVLETRVEAVPRADGGWSAYCVQPAIARESLLVDVLLRCTDERAHALLDRLLDIVLATVTERVGLDADVSNWCLVDDELLFLDVTTPLLRDEQLRDLLDYGLFLPSLPAFVRFAITPSFGASMLAKFYRPRAVIVDVLCGLIRERVGRVAHLMARANQRLAPRLTFGELRRTFIVNQTIWSIYRKLQRLECWWSVSIRGRRYPFLLPPPSAFAGHLAAAPLFRTRLE